MKPKAIIFDLDGTLLDTLASIADAFNQALTEMGHPTVEVDAFRHIIGNGARVSAWRCLPETHRSDQEVEQCRALFENFYEASWQLATPYPGMIETIETLSGHVPLAVLSNKDASYTHACVDHYFPGKFAAVVGFSHRVPHKPDPTGGLGICESLDVAPADTWLVGDTATDMETAVNGGMTGVGAEWGFRDREELERSGATLVLQAPTELPVLYHQ